jgi:hypothetical protein
VEQPPLPTSIIQHTENGRLPQEKSARVSQSTLEKIQRDEECLDRFSPHHPVAVQRRRETLAICRGKTKKTNKMASKAMAASTSSVTSAAAAQSTSGPGVVEWEHLDKKKFYVLAPLASLATRFALYPSNLVKTRLQAQTGKLLYRGTWDAFVKIWQFEGLKGLYKVGGVCFFFCFFFLQRDPVTMFCCDVLLDIAVFARQPFVCEASPLLPRIPLRLPCIPICFIMHGKCGGCDCCGSLTADLRRLQIAPCTYSLLFLCLLPFLFTRPMMRSAHTIPHPHTDLSHWAFIWARSVHCCCPATC